jgi:hypothetical protein
MKKLETESYGATFGLFLYYEMHLPMDKVLQIVQAACKTYNSKTNRYEPKVLYYDKYRKGNIILVPRLAPPRSKVEPIVREIEAQLGVQSAEDGRLAFVSFTDTVQQLLKQDPGRH